MIRSKSRVMKRILACALAAAGFLAAAPIRPKLVLAIVIDQFRYDYLTRFRSEYHAGFERLLTRGAVFTNARYEHFPTVTAVGHSTFLSGATPSLSGIIANEWYDREEGKSVTSVSDSTTKLLGGTGASTGASPHRMLVDTVGDELKMADESKSKVIGISLKDRAAILPAGHMANGAFWFDAKSGNFVSSTYYFADLPAWVQDFNNSRPADQYRGANWLSKVMPPGGATLYAAIDASPFANEMIERMAEIAIQAEQLGQRDVTDLLAVSFSANDYVGHAAGPDSPEVHDISVQTDKVLERLFNAIDEKLGLDNVIVILTGDHGVAPLPEVDAQRKMPGGRLPSGIVSKTVQAALVKKYGDGSWIVSSAEQSIYLNLELIAQKNLFAADVNRTAADAAAAIPHVFRVYTREQLIYGAALPDPVTRRVMNGYYARRGADVEVLLDPYWIFPQTGATHGAPFGYDTHVPVIFMGPGIRAGRYDAAIAINDIAPTLASMLDVETPSGSVGRVLTEMLGQ
jgi:predicted AlkP superfamily pyrophosphatase or phosphodiesterase